MTTVLNTHRSRFGFHTTDYGLFQKLKRLHKWYWRAVYDFHRWHRWNRKLPANRRGPEPDYCRVFVLDQPWFKPIKRGEVRGYKLLPKTVTDLDLVAVYHDARRPRAEPVTPLDDQEVARLESVYQQAAAYYER